MRSPSKNGLSVSDVESQYDAYLIRVRGLSRSPRNLHHHVVHRFFSSRFPTGYVTWSEVRFNDFVQFLSSEFARLHNRGTQTAWLMISSQTISKQRIGGATGEKGRPGLTDGPSVGWRIHHRLRFVDWRYDSR
jgi:hypothetical protein